jgi:proton-translocating NAD(P)+ transhydrogenase subunit alpha
VPRIPSVRKEASVQIGVPRESRAHETRVAATPKTVAQLVGLGYEVVVENGAGARASFDDGAYAAAGARVVIAEEAWGSDIVHKVNAPSDPEIARLRPGTVLVSLMAPALDPVLVEKLRAAQVTAMAMDAVPRISRAQSLDVLSSMANIAGYRAVIEAAHHFGRFFTGQITAAGKVPPARVFVIGAGVAGLAAIGAASGLGAIVRANDTRPEVADQVKSMGGEFAPVDYEEEGTGVGGYARVMSDGFLKAQAQVFAKEAKEADIVITTALIPGKPAPKLITAEMVRSMRPGSVIVDLAAEQGGNCELTVPHEVTVKHGVTIIGYTDLPSRLARQSSTLYATNLLRLTEELCKTKDGVIDVNMEDEVIRGTTVVKDGAITWPPPAPKISAAPPAKAKAAAASPAANKAHDHGKTGAPASAKAVAILFALGAALFWFIGTYAPAAFLNHFTVFVLACFVGYMVVWNVTPALHTPLMSVTNAISSIIAIGALVQVAPPLLAEAGAGRPADWILGLAIVALALTSINMFGGFAVTRRMLQMFRK